MDRRADAASRWLALTTLFGLLLAAVLAPALAGWTADGSSPVTAAVVALTAALLTGRGRLGALQVRVATVRVASERRAAPYLSSRVTDTRRSPLRPRAPGLV